MNRMTRGDEVGDFFGFVWAKILDLWDAIRDLLANLASDFKESNRYFKIKVGLIGGYVSICLATIMIFPPPGELNEIGARLNVSRTEIVGGWYFLVVNESSDTWKRIELTFNDRFQASSPALRPGKKKAFYFFKFKDDRGAAPPKDIKPRKLRIVCSEGVFERDFTKNQ